MGRLMTNLMITMRMRTLDEELDDDDGYWDGFVEDENIIAIIMAMKLPDWFDNVTENDEDEICGKNVGAEALF